MPQSIPLIRGCASDEAPQTDDQTGKFRHMLPARFAKYRFVRPERFEFPSSWFAGRSCHHALFGSRNRGVHPSLRGGPRAGASKSYALPVAGARGSRKRFALFGHTDCFAKDLTHLFAKSVEEIEEQLPRPAEVINVSHRGPTIEDI